MRLLLAFMVAALVVTQACGPTTKGLAHEGAGIVVDCATQNAKQLTDQIAPTIEQVLLLAKGADGKVDGGVLEASARSYAIDTGWCALENTVSRMLARAAPAGAPMSSPEELAGLRDTLAALRAKLHPGVTFKVEQ